MTKNICKTGDLGAYGIAVGISYADDVELSAVDNEFKYRPRKDALDTGFSAYAVAVVGIFGYFLISAPSYTALALLV
jgi:hypothetical protein